MRDPATDHLWPVCLDQNCTLSTRDHGAGLKVLLARSRRAADHAPLWPYLPTHSPNGSLKYRAPGLSPLLAAMVPSFQPRGPARRLVGVVAAVGLAVAAALVATNGADAAAGKVEGVVVDSLSDAPPGEAAAAATGGGGKVVTLTDTNFKEEIAKGGVVFVKFLVRLEKNSTAAYHACFCLSWPRVARLCRQSLALEPRTSCLSTLPDDPVDFSLLTAFSYVAVTLFGDFLRSPMLLVPHRPPGAPIAPRLLPPLPRPLPRSPPPPLLTWTPPSTKQLHPPFE